MAHPNHSQCVRCKHLIGKYFCSAFPEGIPHEYISNRIIHNEVASEQEGPYIYEHSEAHKKVLLRWEQEKHRLYSEREVIIKELPALFLKEVQLLSKLEDWNKAIYKVEIISVRQTSMSGHYGTIFKNTKFHIMNNVEKQQLIKIRRSEFSGKAMQLLRTEVIEKGIKQITFTIYSNGEFEYRFS